MVQLVMFSVIPNPISENYFEALDTVTNELKNRFCQERGMPVAAKLEKILLDAANNTFRSEEFSGDSTAKIWTQHI